ncbi:MAG: glycosyltransferase family 4 protein, partial [Leptolyngbyaceae bacterium]|nr:glycosyltransferase family 4 protein [Leptolyngbyaceae bacterium]
MKPKILQITSGHSMGWTGGITATLTSLATSRLAEEFDFLVMPWGEAEPLLATLKPDLIVVHAASSWRGLINLWKLRGIAKVMINEHHYSANFERFNVASKFRFRWMLRLAYGLAHRTIAASADQQAWMLRYKLATERKITLIRSCRTLDGFLAVPESPRAIGQPFRLVAYGRLAFQKGFDVLIKAMNLLPPDMNIQLQIGGTGADEAHLRELAGASSRIQFMGRIDDVPAFLSQCDAVVIPSRWEPGGNVC